MKAPQAQDSGSGAARRLLLFGFEDFFGPGARSFPFPVVQRRPYSMALSTRSPRDPRSSGALWLRQGPREGDVYSAHPELGSKLKALKLVSRNVEAAAGKVISTRLTHNSQVDPPV